MLHPNKESVMRLIPRKPYVLIKPKNIFPPGESILPIKDDIVPAFA